MGNPAAKYGTTRDGGGPERDNFNLGGSENWVGDFAAGGTQQAQQQGAQTARMQATAGSRSAQAQNRTTPQTNFTGANISMGAAGAANNNAGTAAQQQGNVFGDLREFARGPEGPSAAQAMLNKGANRAMSQNLSLARSGSGFGESAGAVASAQRANTDTMASAANDAATLRANEAAQHRGQSLSALNAAGGIAGARGQTELGRGNLSLATAGQQASQAQFETTAELQAQQQRDAAAQGFASQELEAFGAGAATDAAARDRELAAMTQQQAGTMGLEQINAQNYAADQAHQAKMRELDQAKDQAIVSGITGAVGAVGSFMPSDRRTKKDVRSAVDLRAAFAELS
jgi:hypothetical protein